MQILFEAFYFTEEYWKLIESGIKSVEDEFDYEKDCELKPVLLNVRRSTIIKPMEDGKYTFFSDGYSSLTLNINFNDYIKLVPHNSAKILKTRWAN